MGRKKDEEPIIVRCFVQMYPEREDKNAKTYAERMAPTLMPIEEYFEKVKSKRQFCIDIHKRIAREVYGVEVEVDE